MDQRLVDAVLRGSLSQQAELLLVLNKISADKQRELLRLAVKSGRLESVAWLLGRGIDPTMSDGDSSSALQLAEELEAKNVDEDNWKNISKLLRLVRDRSAPSPASTGVTGPETGQLSRPSVNPVLQQSLSVMSTLSKDVSSLNESLGKLAGDVTSLQDGLQKHHFGVKKEIDMVGKVVEESLDKMRASVALRDDVLKKLEEKLVSLSTEIQPLCEFMADMRTRVTGTGGSASAGQDVSLGDVLGGGDREEKLRRRCIDVLMCRTELVKRTQENVSKVKEFYEKLYDGSLLTRCLLRYLQLRADVQFVIDFDSYYIGDLKGTVVDLAGKQCRGSSLYSYADFKEKVVYLGGKVSSSWSVDRVIGQYAMSLAQMCLSLEYMNSGRPYASGDSRGFDELRRALEETKEGWSVEDSYFDDKVKEWAGSSSDLEKQVCLVAAVPGMLATFGSADGILRARRKMRSLTKFYEGMVMPRLWKVVESSTHQ